MTTPNTVTTRAKREATISIQLDRTTQALRSITTGATPQAQARAVVLRYCRAVGITAEAVTDEAIAFLSSPTATAMEIEAIDEWLVEHAGAVAAASAVQRAMRGA
ncbi:MAG: hypothetical protein JNK55_20345 [Rubrivivax sp.]|nr:hypothetical protein [Rubrivivax sp.]